MLNFHESVCRTPPLTASFRAQLSHSLQPRAFIAKIKKPFNIADELGDLTFRSSARKPSLRSDGHASSLRSFGRRSGHQRSFPDRPVARSSKEGFIGSEAREHVGYMGYTMQLKRMYEETARRSLKR